MENQVIPILIICYNNGYYVKNTIDQLLSKFILPEQIIILNNNSDGIETKKILKELEESKFKIYNFTENKGHTVWKLPEVFNDLPDYFAVTDPDLGFNKNLPNSFLQDFKEISQVYNAAKVGFALDITSDGFYKTPYIYSRSIKEWESQFWHNLSYYKDFALYTADIDTTFFLGSKIQMRNNNKCVRVAGNYTADHLPWIINHNYSLGYDRLVEMYGKSTGISTTAGLIMNSIIPVTRNEKLFYVEKDNSHRDRFWTIDYNNWEFDTFSIFDKYVRSGSIVLDIGAWIGPTVLYCAKLGANIIAVEADTGSVQTLKNNINLNNLNNQITIIDKAIYKHNNGVCFGENLNRNDGMNASTSQIVPETSHKEKYMVPSITFLELVKDIDPLTISLIKVDIEGGEEFILYELLNWCCAHSVPTYVSFHFTWWTDEGKKSFRNTFTEIFENYGLNDLCNKVINDPFCSILFHKQN